MNTTVNATDSTHTGYSTTDDESDIVMSENESMNRHSESESEHEDKQNKSSTQKQCRKRRSNSTATQSNKRAHINNNDNSALVMECTSTPSTHQSAVLSNTHTSSPAPVPLPFIQLNNTNNKQLNKLMRWLSILGTTRVKQLMLMLSTFFLLFWSYNTATLISYTINTNPTHTPTIQARSYNTHRISMYNYTTVTRMINNNNNLNGNANTNTVQPIQHIYLQQYHTFHTNQQQLNRLSSSHLQQSLPLQLISNIQQPHRTHPIRRIIECIGGCKCFVAAITGLITAAICYFRTSTT